MLKNLLKKRIRILIYLIFLLGIGLSIVIYIDSVRLFNLKKIIYSLSGNVELADFERVVRSISPDNMLQAKLEIVNNQPYLTMEGFAKESLKKQNSRILKRNILHPSFCLSLFSMGYATDYFLEHYKKGTLNETKIKILEDVYLFISKEILNPISFNTVTVADHVTSERIQFISIFASYIKQYYPEKKKLLKALAKDFNICYGFLLDRKSFTWQTNHGIMQLRSLAQVVGIITNEKLQESILEVFEERLTNIIPYHIGPDGSIYEAASGYWIYILNQFTKITEIESTMHLKSIATLKDMLQKSKLFIETVAANNGFLQGLGDSYSTRIFDTLKNSEVPENRYFLFSNELAGANWSVKNKDFNVLFVSLHTPPNVHKLPEDLAVYLYADYPIFSNTGTYSFDASKERLYFRTEKSQSTVSPLFIRSDEAVSSHLAVGNFQPDNNILTLIGEKHYSNSKSVKRDLVINPNHEIKITDHSSNNDTLITHFNLHPGIKIKKTDEKQILLQTPDSVIISFTSNCSIDIIDGIISERKEEITSIQRLELTGNPIETKVNIPESALAHKMVLANFNSEESRRFKYAELLESQYENPRYIEHVRKLVIFRTAITMLVFSFFVTITELLVSKKKKKISGTVKKI